MLQYSLSSARNLPVWAICVSFSSPSPMTPCFQTRGQRPVSSLKASARFRQNRITSKVQMNSKLQQIELAVAQIKVRHVYP